MQLENNESFKGYPISFSPEGIEFGPFLLTRNAIVTKGVVTVNDLKELGVFIRNMEKGEPWILGDLIRYGRKKSFDFLNKITQMYRDPMKVAISAQMAELFPPNRRKPKLSFQHHVEVSTLPTDLQDEILEHAEKQRWSARKLKQHVREAHQRLTAQRKDDQ